MELRPGRNRLRCRCRPAAATATARCITCPSRPANWRRLISRGRMITRSRLPASVKSGNLVAADGAVVMQSSSTVVGFRPTLEIESKLAAALSQNPDNPGRAGPAGRTQARPWRGRRRARRLASFAPSAAGSPYERVGGRHGAGDLRYDFADSRKEATESNLTLSTRAAIEFHRLMARGLLQEGSSHALEHDLPSSRTTRSQRHSFPSANQSACSRRPLSPRTSESFTGSARP